LLTTDQCLPQRVYAMAFVGPAALARDIRLRDGDVLASVSPGVLDGAELRLAPLQAPAAVRQAYELTPPNGEAVPVCDYASAGISWDGRSTFSAWLRP
jgi:hypothetical protein